MKRELQMLRDIFSNPTDYPWTVPIAHLIPRDPTFSAWGDSSLYAAGGFSLDLQFWWYLDWPPVIELRTLKYYSVSRKDPVTNELISINLLEFAVIIINYAIANHLVSQ